MNKFDSLLKTNTNKRKFQYNYTSIYKKDRSKPVVDYNYFESIYIQELWRYNKKYNKDLISLWGRLDMKSYIDYDLGNTINPYFLDNNKKICKVSQLDDYNYMSEDARYMHLLDIKYIKHLHLEKIELNNIYLATFEILDSNNKYRPYVLIFTKDINNKFVEIRIWI